MTAYAIRLANGQDSAERMRRADAMGLWPSGVGMARQGLRPDGGGAVSVVAGSMTVDVQPFTGWVDGGVSDAQGGYSFVSDAVVQLTVSPGHASLLRVDTVVAEVRDNTYDASGFTDARVRIVEGVAGAGAPALPTSCIPLRNINVPAGASAGTGGLASGDLGTDRRTYTTGLGGVLSVTDKTARDALAPQRGWTVFREDVDRLETWDGYAWVPQGPVVVSGQAEQDALYLFVGLQVYRTDLDELQVYTSAGWRVATLTDPADTGEWTAFTPTWAASGGGTPSVGTGGNAYLGGRYRKIGRTVHFHAAMRLGASGFSLGSGAWSFGLPVPARPLAPGGIGSHGMLLSGFMEDAGVEGYLLPAGRFSTGSSTAVDLLYQIKASGVTGLVGPTAPFTWGAGDWVTWSGTYESAS